MNKHTDHLDYNDFQAIVQNARMQRSVAVGDAIASLVSATLFGLTRAVDAIKSATSGLKCRSAANADSALDVPAHR
jgi:hypothetical protein